MAGLFARLFGRKKPQETAVKTQARKATLNLRAKVDLQSAVDAGVISSLLNKDVSQNGNMSLNSGLKIDGKTIGDVKTTDGMVWVHSSGVVEGNIQAPTVHIYGRVTGNVVADLVVLMDSAQVSGEIYADATLILTPASMEIHSRLSNKESFNSAADAYRHPNLVALTPKRQETSTSEASDVDAPRAANG